MTKVSDWLNASNQAFSLVKMMSSISLSLYDLSYEIFTMHAPYTDIHVMHLTILWKNLQAYNTQHSV